jgi:hypothetical protein
MARVPDPTPGLIVRYGYLWLAEFRQQRTDPSKDRPACVVMQILDEQPHRLEIVGGHAVAPGDVVIMPITTRPPERDTLAIELTANEKRACGLDFAIPSWLILSEFNVDTWPNADLALVPGTGRFAHGLAPPGLVRRISQGFVDAARSRRAVGVRR